MTSRRLYVVNESTHVSLIEAKRMVEAVNKQLRDHFQPVWGHRRIVVEYLSADLATAQEQVPPGSWVIGLFDNSDQAGALGWHSVDDRDRVYGKVFTEPSIAAGSTALTGPYAISSVLSHEACETEADPPCNAYSDTGRGYFLATEVCDPVEADVYEIDGVTVSNFVTPAWFDPWAPATEKFDHLDRVHAPFTMSPGGYWVQIGSGTESQKFADLITWETQVGFDIRAQGNIIFSSEMPVWLRELKMARGRNLIKRIQSA